ncbi:MAG: response regulator [Planctomycetes bacterium]|nr:response regulator [Planctomycetota bacterium]
MRSAREPQRELERELAAYTAITRVLTFAVEDEDASVGLLQLLGEFHGYAVGAYWGVDEDARVLRCRGIWRRSAPGLDEWQAALRTLTFAPGVGLPGRAWACGRAEWVEDVAAAPSFTRGALAARAGLHAALACPVAFRGVVHGVLELFADQSELPRPELPRTISAAVNQFSQFLARRRAEKALVESEALFQDLVDNATDMVFRVALNGALLFANRALYAALGFQAERGHDLSLMDFLHPDALAAWTEAVGRLLAQPGTTPLEVRFLTRDGRVLPIEGTATADVVEGILTSIRCICRDVSSRLELERVRERLLSIATHELRNPLASITGAVALVESGQLGALAPKASHLLEVALRNCRRMNELIDSLLDVDKTRAGELELDIRPIGLGPLLERAAEAARAHGAPFGVGIRFQEPIVNVEVSADESRLLQVLANLLSNAVRFSPPGADVVLSLSRNAGFARVCVTDRGPGIPSEHRQRLFEPFFQALRPDPARGRGSGLGLSIAKAMVKRLGGRIGFDAEPGLGTTFWFELPELLLAVAPPPASCPVSREASPERTRILICEDDATFAGVLAKWFDDAGHEAHVACSAREAMRLLDGNHYAGMTLDLGLPGEDGFEFVRQVREGERERRGRLPILVVSGRPCAAESVGLVGAAGADAWFQKPVSRADLLLAMERAVRSAVESAVQILHVEDDPDTRALVREVLAEVGSVSPCASLEEARRRLADTPFDLLVLDQRLPDGSGLDLLPELRKRALGAVPVLVFSAWELESEPGPQVSAVLTKLDATNAQLAAAVRALVKRRTVAGGG